MSESWEARTGDAFWVKMRRSTKWGVCLCFYLFLLIGCCCWEVNGGESRFERTLCSMCLYTMTWWKQVILILQVVLLFIAGCLCRWWFLCCCYCFPLPCWFGERLLELSVKPEQQEAGEKQQEEAGHTTSKHGIGKKWKVKSKSKLG